MFKQIPVYILILLSLCCTPSTTYINRDADKEDAVRITEKFYDLLKQKDYQNIFPLCSMGTGDLLLNKEINYYDLRIRHLFLSLY